MSLEILFLRHGQAARAADINDFDRPLTSRGKRQAQKIGAWLQSSNLQPDAVLCSPAKRAYDTAAKAIKAAGLHAGLISIDPRLYFDSTRNLMAALAASSDVVTRLLVVGHNPWMEELVLSLPGERPKHPGGNWYMKTGALMHFAVSDLRAGLYPGQGRLLAHVIPGDLPDLFPYPGATGTEMRERPAYYYTQSAVIPYRKTEGGLEILIVSSGGKKHWVVPKGIHEPGLSAAASAAKEAEEEAGVTGRVSDELVGEYIYEKWGAMCTVAVYAMEVTAVDGNDAAWPDENRNRCWVAADQAAALMKEPALGEIIAGFAEGF